MLSIVLNLAPRVGLAHPQCDYPSNGKHLFILSGQSNMNGLDPEASFIPAIKTALGDDNFIVVKDAKGGQPIHRWIKDDNKRNYKPSSAQNGDLYDRLIRKVTKAINGQQLASVSFVWMQGESDANKQSALDYDASLAKLVLQLKTDLGRDNIQVVIGRLSDHGVKSKKFPYWEALRETQVNFANSQPLGAWVDTDDLNDGVNRTGNTVSLSLIHI